MPLANQSESVHRLQRAVYFGEVALERGRRRDEMIAISGSHTLLAALYLCLSQGRAQSMTD